jgi:hypothetical protein
MGIMRCLLSRRAYENNNRQVKTVQPSQNRTSGIELHRPNGSVTNSHHSPCQILAEGGTWWQDSSNHGKGQQSLGHGACSHNLQVTHLMRVAVSGYKTLLKVSRELTLEGTLV